tara:strand:+ start:97 stop:372 length:276 start_codon:yes stop_codon:yes gene_type:complete
VINSIFGNIVRHQPGVGYLLLHEGLSVELTMLLVGSHEFGQNGLDTIVDTINNRAAVNRAKYFSNFEDFARSVLKDAYRDALNGWGTDNKI